MRIVIDGSLCTGHGRCYTLVPELFESDEAGQGVVTAGELSEEQIPLAQTAISNCPERCIRLED